MTTSSRRAALDSRAALNMLIDRLGDGCTYRGQRLPSCLVCPLLKCRYDVQVNPASIEDIKQFRWERGRKPLDGSLPIVVNL